MSNSIKILGSDYPRVTTIIAETEDAKKKQNLLKWMKKMQKIHGIEGAEIERQKILDNGTSLHQAIEDYLSGKEPLDHPQFTAVLPFLKLIKQSNDLILEKRLFCHKYKYQGKPDLIGIYDGLTTIIDWTTSLQLKRKEWVDHKFLQAGAYAIACEEIGIEIQQLAVVTICQNPRTFQIFTDPPYKWRIEFLKRLGKYKALLGEDL
jgi:hypothetical protein